MTETFALRSDAANPALDAGNDALAPGSDSTGNPRVDQPLLANNGAKISDLGAVEVQSVLAETASLIVDTDADVVNAFDGRRSLREAIAHASSGTLSGTITFTDGVSEVFETGDGTDLITDFELDVDVIDLSATGLAFGDLTIFGGLNALIDTGTDLITVNGVTAAQLNSDQFDFGG